MNPSLEKPTNVRYGVLAFACVLSMITYLDRVCMGTIAPYVESEFKLKPGDMGWVFGSFALAYALFEVPTGWLGDVFGPRKTLIRIVLWWSAFTALSGSIYPTFFFAFYVLLGVRFLFGIGEAGAYPNIARAFHNWFPFTERGFAKGTVWMAGRFAGGITPFIVLALVYETPVAGSTPASHWRHIFWIFGIIGVAWCGLFWFWFRDRPEQNPLVNQAEIDLIHEGEPGPKSAFPHAQSHGRLQVPWRKLLASRNLWLLCGMYFCATYGWYVNITFLPGYIKDRMIVDYPEVNDKWSKAWWEYSIMAGLPLLVGALACIVGGLLTDLFIKRTGDRKWGRRLFGMLGHSLCAAFYFLCLSVMGYASPWPFVICIATATFWNDLTMGAAWASCIDIGRRYAGIVSGCMNTIGNLGGAVAGVITGWILKYHTAGLTKGTEAFDAADHQAWVVNFIIFGACYVVAVFLWMGFDATKPVAPDE